MIYTEMLKKKTASATLSGPGESLECYWHGTQRRVHIPWFPDYLYWICYLAHSILIRKLQWHLAEQLFSDLRLPTAAKKQTRWSKSQLGPIFNLSCAKMMNLGAELSGGSRTHMYARRMFCSSPKRHLPGSHIACSVWHSRQGQTALPGRAGPLQGRRTWAIGFTVNTKYERAWEMRRDIKAGVPRGRTRMRMRWREEHQGEKKQVAAASKHKESFMNYGR